MRRAIGLFTLLCTVSAARAEPADVAELFPADTLLYVEANQPGAVGKDLTAYLKGTVFANNPPDFKPLRQRQDGGFNSSPAGLIAAMLAPEMLKEFGQFKGLAGGIVGFDRQGEAEWLLALLPGDSKLPGFLLKNYITHRADIRKVTSVEGVDLYQRGIIQFGDDPLAPNGPQPVEKMAPIGPVYVNHAGLILIGTSREHVSAAIRRFKEKEKSGSLRSSPAFKSLVEERAKPGILMLADARRIAEQADRSYRDEYEGAPTPWLALNNLLPAKSFTTLTARMEFKDNDVCLRARLRLDTKAMSPLERLLEGASLSSADLNKLPADSPFALTVALPREQRANRLLTALDAIIRSTGTLGPNASEVLQELESSKLLSRDDLAKVTRITIAQPPTAGWVKNQTPVPMLLVHAEEAALDKLEAAIPTVLEILSGFKADPVAETIDGVRIRSLEAKASPLGRTIHYGRHAGAIGVGTDRKTLAHLLVTPSRPNPLLQHLDQPAIVCVWNWVETMRGSQTSSGKKDAGPRGGVILGGYPQSGPYYPGMPNRPLRLTPDALTGLEGLPPLVMSLARRDDQLVIDIRQSDPKGIRAKGISRLFEWFGRTASNWGGHGGYPVPGSFDGPIDLLPPLPPGPFPQDE